jgi:L-amino acid N-acyltransferase YncA
LPLPGSFQAITRYLVAGSRRDARAFIEAGLSLKQGFIEAGLFIETAAMDGRFWTSSG